MNNDDLLLLDNQVCFPLYACARKVVNAYTPYLSELNLTYTQYLTMMVMWEVGEISVKDLGKRLYLDSGTLTPVIKKLCSMDYISKSRATDDERVVVVRLTEQGRALKEKAYMVPQKLICRISQSKGFSPDEAQTLKALLLKLLHTVE